MFSMHNSKQQLRVLITGGGGAGSEMLWKLWKDKYNLFFADEVISKIHPSIPYSRRIVVPKGSEPDFIDRVFLVVREFSIDVIISQVDEELLAIASNLDSLAPTISLTPQATFVELFLDKYASGLSLSANRIQEPETRLLGPTTLFENVPLLIKPRFGRGSRNIFKVNNVNEFDSLRAYLSTFQDEFVCQNMIEGKEFSVQMLATMSGALRSIVPVLINSKIGSTTSGRICNNELIIGICEEFHSKYSPKGTYNIQLMLESASKTPHIFEVNPRVSTTMCLGVFGGVDPIEIFLQSDGSTSRKMVQDDIALQRYWGNYIFESVQP